MTTDNATTEILADERLLTPEYVPEDRLVDREEELAEIEYAVNPMIFGREPDDLLVHGPTGTGKTTCVRYSARRQARYASEQGVRAGWAYVDCLEASTDAAVARTVATQINDPAVTGLEIPESGLSTDEYRTRLRRILDERFDAALLVLDGLDRLDTDRLPVLSEGDDVGPESCLVSVVGIVDGRPDATTLTEQFRTTVAETTCRFEPYSVERLREILDARRDAFADGALKPAAVSRTAELASDPHGDAGKAIAILRLAGQLARERGEPVVRQSAVEEAADDVECLRIRDAVGALSTHSQLVLLALASLTGTHEENAFRTARIYESYVEQCRERGERPRSERRVQDYLNEHASLGLTAQRARWGGRADGNYNTHRLLTRPDVLERALDNRPVR